MSSDRMSPTDLDRIGRRRAILDHDLRAVQDALEQVSRTMTSAYQHHTVGAVDQVLAAGQQLLDATDAALARPKTGARWYDLTSRSAYVAANEAARLILTIPVDDLRPDPLLNRIADLLGDYTRYRDQASDAAAEATARRG